MEAEVVTVGSELLFGTLSNSNLTHISAELDRLGIDVAFATTVRDEESEIAGALRAAIDRAGAVVVTGGLGPTHDDLTREALAAVTGRHLRREPGLEKDLREFFGHRGRPMPEVNLRQACIPEGATPIPNPLGTAPGIALECEGTAVYALPGVPGEMRHMLEHHVLADLRRRGAGGGRALRVLRIAGRGESDIMGLIEPVIDRCRRGGLVKVTILASGGELSLHLRAAQGDAEAVEEAASGLREQLGDLVYGSDADSLASVVLREASARGLTLAVAESFTGGALTSRLIDVPGASAVVKAAFVAYSVEAKARDLSVPEDLLAGHGAVSGEVARAMAQGARRRAGTSFGVSTTGEAGPDPAGAPVGSMFVGLAWAGGSRATGLRVPGDRAAVRERGCVAALDALRRLLLEAPGR